jgi:hypothetical protein
MPLRIIPDRSERPEHFVQSARSKGADVFDERVLRADFLDEAVELPPQTASLARQSGASPGGADILAGESSAEHIHGNSICRESRGIERFNVFIDWHPRPMLVEDGTAERFDFAKRNSPKPTRAFQTQREPPESAEQIEHV